MDQMITYVFYAFAGLTVLSALAILLLRNILYAAVGLMGTFLGVSALYVFAGADFLAVTQLVVYVGGILILMIFGVMLSRKSANDTSHVLSSTARRAMSLLVSIGLFGVLFFAISQSTFTAIQPNEAHQTSTKIDSLGKLLMTDYVLPFELAAVILLVALIGAIYVAGKKDNHKTV